MYGCVLLEMALNYLQNKDLWDLGITSSSEFLWWEGPMNLISLHDHRYLCVNFTL